MGEFGSRGAAAIDSLASEVLGWKPERTSSEGRDYSTSARLRHHHLT